MIISLDHDAHENKSARDRTWEEVLRSVNENYLQAGFPTNSKSGDLLIVKNARAEAELVFSSWKEMRTQVSDVIEQ